VLKLDAKVARIFGNITTMSEEFKIRHSVLGISGTVFIIFFWWRAEVQDVQEWGAVDGGIS